MFPALWRKVMVVKQKLELTWIGKNIRPKLEPRILIENPEKSYHAKHKITDNDIYDNILKKARGKSKNNFVILEKENLNELLI